MIIKIIKDFTWSYDQENNWLVITNIRTQDRVAVPKAQMFSLARFLVRVSQKLSHKGRNKRKV